MSESEGRISVSGNSGPLVQNDGSKIVAHCLFASTPASNVVPLLPPRPTSMTLRIGGRYWREVEKIATYELGVFAELLTRAWGLVGQS